MKDELLAELRRQITGREQEPAEAVFKDIQLFKGRPADARKEKAIAREMILMARGINEKLQTIEGIESDPPVINCTTCHRGQKKPAISLDPPPAG